MKTGRKILIFLLALGILVFILGLAMVGFNFKKLNSGGEYEMKTFETNEQVSFLNVDVDDASVTLVRAENGTGLKAEYEENKRHHYETECRNGKFSLVSVRQKWYERIMNFQIVSPKITLYVGEEFDEIHLIAKNGKITSEINLKTGVLYAETDNGKLTFDGISVIGNADISSDNGSVILKNATIGGCLTAEADNGSVTLENVSADGGISAETDNGKILFQNVTTQGKLSGESDNGEIKADGVTATEIYLKTDNGAVKGYDLTGENIGMYSSNGNITATIKGVREEFLIRSKTDLGNSNVSNTDSGSKQLTAKTNLGNINITFLG